MENKSLKQEIIDLPRHQRLILNFDIIYIYFLGIYFLIILITQPLSDPKYSFYENIYGPYLLLRIFFLPIISKIITRHNIGNDHINSIGGVGVKIQAGFMDENIDRIKHLILVSSSKVENFELFRSQAFSYIDKELQSTNLPISKWIKIYIYHFFNILGFILQLLFP